MKRSRFINLLLIGTGMIALTACDQKPNDHQKATGAQITGAQINGQVFKDEAECQKFKPAEDCKKAFEESRRLHEQTAPKFNSREECEKIHGIGKCTEPSGHHGGGIFMPMMMGYMFGQMMGGRAQPAMPVTSAAAAGTPWRGATAAPNTVQRGGFGGTGNAFRSSGG